MRWLCRCDCGTEKVIRGNHLLGGKIVSCDCYGKQALAKSITKHGLKDHRLYGVWNNMKNRCYNKKLRSYPRYGGRGIKVCDEWLHDFQSFYDWAISTGYDDKAAYM